MSDCKYCDSSYTCPSCQVRIKAERELQFREWMIEAVVALGKALNVELPDPPKKRDWQNEKA